MTIRVLLVCLAVLAFGTFGCGDDPSKPGDVAGGGSDGGDVGPGGSGGTSDGGTGGESEGGTGGGSEGGTGGGTGGSDGGSGGEVIACGNDRAEADEECDGTDLRGSTCKSLGYPGGELGCHPGCVYDVSDCQIPPEICDNGIDDNFDGATDCEDASCIDDPFCDPCGDGVVMGGEDCDGTNLNGASCADVGFPLGGTLKCDASCSFDTTGCFVPEVCDNGIDDDGDGATDCNDSDCEDDIVACPSCGDGVANQPGELCDGADLREQTCESRGLLGGTLKCNGSCTFDESECLRPEICNNGIDDDGDGATDCEDVEDCFDDIVACPRCGDGMINQASEVCDGNDIASSCVDQGFSVGTLQCNAACEYDTSLCVQCADNCGDPACVGAWECPSCGDGVLQQGELCDVGIVDSTCADESFDAGTLLCNGTCDGYDTSACYFYECGNGTVEPGEQCDDGGTDPGDGCDANCQWEAPPGESCAAPLDLNAHWDGTLSAWAYNGDTTGMTSDYPSNGCGSTVNQPDFVASFTAPADGWYEFNVMAAPDMVMYALDGICDLASSQVFCVDNEVSGGGETIRVQLSENQQVFIVIAPWSFSGTDIHEGPFTLSVEESGPPGGVDAEPNDTMGSASEIGMLPYGLFDILPQGLGSLTPATDVDWWWFEFTAGVPVEIWTEVDVPGISYCGVGDEFDTHIALYDSSGTLIQSNDDDAGFGVVCSVIPFTPPTTAIYFIEVKVSPKQSTPTPILNYELVVGAPVTP